jgi:hypothetical protein
VLGDVVSLGARLLANVAAQFDSLALAATAVPPASAAT